MTLTYYVPVDSEVAIFVVPARGALDAAMGHTGVTALGATVFRPGGLAIEVLKWETVQAGLHSIVWRVSESTFRGAPLPFGYYRVFLQTEYALGCWDVLYVAPSGEHF